MDKIKKRYIGLDVHKHYLIALGVDENLEVVLPATASRAGTPGGLDEKDAHTPGRGGAGDDHQHLAVVR